MTADPSSADTTRTTPPTSELTFVSRYAFDVTVAGTVTVDIAGPTRTTAVLILARSTASGVSVTSTASSLVSRAATSCPPPGPAIRGIASGDSTSRDETPGAR